MKKLTYKRVITFGTFDLFHIGHLRIIQRARALGDYLIVGVSSDELHYTKKHSLPVYPYAHRADIVGAIQGVDMVFREESLELKREYIITHQADILVMGDDWQGKFDFLKDVCKIKYLPRTPMISSTQIKSACKSQNTFLMPTETEIIRMRSAAAQ